MAIGVIWHPEISNDCSGIIGLLIRIKRLKIEFNLRKVYFYILNTNHFIMDRIHFLGSTGIITAAGVSPKFIDTGDLITALKRDKVFLG